MKRNFSKFISLILLVVFSLNLCGCDVARELKDDLANRMDINSTNISCQEIVRHIIEAVNDENAMADSYSSIPESQREDISYSMYFEYINILRDLSSQDNRNITYFRLLNAMEVRNIVGDKLFSSYNGLVGVELQYTDKDGNAESLEDPLFIFLLEIDGVTTLSHKWISGTIDIYNYHDHYFTMLDEQSSDGVFALLDPGLSGLYPDSVIRAMSDGLIEYYKVDVKSSRDQYRVTVLTPNLCSVKIPETIGQNEELIEHYVSISRDVSGVYHIEDIVPFYVNTDMFYLLSGSSDYEMRLLRAGSTYSRSTVVFNLGTPKYEFVRDDDYILVEDGEQMVMYKRTVLMYDNLILIFYADHNSDSWNGILSTITITGSNYFVGNSIRAGMTHNEFLEKYPFMDYFGYNHTFTDDNGTYTIDFIFDDDDVLQEIKIDKDS